MNKRLTFRLLLPVFFTLSLSGCGHLLDDWGLRDETQLPPSYPVDVPPPPKKEGTIYQSGYEMRLYQDRIATRVGDILTVRLEEMTQAQKQAQTKTTKLSNINTNNGSTSNNPSTNGGGSLRPVLFGAPIELLSFNTGSDINFDGKGQTNQSNQLRGTISVTVIRVLSNGNLMIQGESWVTINQGREYIRLSGIVRTEDVDANNTVSSQRIADARISYSGTGQVGNASRGGFMTQLFNKFFPY